MLLHCAATLHHLELAEVFLADCGITSCRHVLKALRAWTEIDSSEALDASIDYNDNIML